jgi:GNAT superfamily N-acetyltransferase
MIVIKELNHVTWPHFVTLFESDKNCSECWCLNHRESAGCPTGAQAKEQMKILCDQDKVNGLLAFQEQSCVGWIAIDPMDRLFGHDCQSSGKAKEWAIHCIFVRHTHRNLGVSKSLIDGAISYAKDKGASLISAFPIPEKNHMKFPLHEAEFSGRLSSFLKLGFKPVKEISDFYLRMELEV